MNCLHLEKTQSDANGKSKHTKAEPTLNLLYQNNDGREFPVPQSGTRIHGTEQLSSAPLSFEIDYNNRLEDYRD